MDRVENVAMPATALTVTVPDSVPPPGLVPMAIVTGAVDAVTVAPPASWMATWNEPMVAPAAVLPGCVMNPTLVAVWMTGVTTIVCAKLATPLTMTETRWTPALTLLGSVADRLDPLKEVTLP